MFSSLHIISCSSAMVDYEIVRISCEYEKKQRL